MIESNRIRRIDRRRLLAGAGGTAAAMAGGQRVGRTQDVAPTATPMPIRIQTPDLAFADPLRELRDVWTSASNADDVILSIVPAEPAPDQLLTDARSGARRFSGALVPNWLIPDLVRDDFILAVDAPSFALPASVAQVRSFGGIWVATDLDHDCDLLFYRRDVLDRGGMTPAATWDELLAQCSSLASDGTGSIALQTTHSQQVVDHFVAMAAPYVLRDADLTGFWFDSETMEPAIVSQEHQAALSTWQALGETSPRELRDGSTGDLWRAFLDGSVAYLVAPADFFPFAMEQGLDPGALGVGSLPGVAGKDDSIIRAGNVAGASWGGVVMSSTGARAAQEVPSLLKAFAGRDSQQALWSNVTSGIVPAPASESDVAAMTAVLSAAGWGATTSKDWLRALLNTFGNPDQLPPLRIAETQRYLAALEQRVVDLIGGAIPTAADALELAAADWREINAQIDVVVQQSLFTKSLMAPPEI